MIKLLIGTNNSGKCEEIKALLSNLDIELVTPKEIGLSLHVEENGNTYAENAAKKALEYAEAGGMLAIADDTGLEVDALGGAPGLYSARFVPKKDASDRDRREYLLNKLASHHRPWLARFRSVVAIADPQGHVRFTEGICTGEIIPEERGAQGFGYDPIFFIPSLGKTMAELSLDQKNQISHRAKAISAACTILLALLS